MFLSMGLGSVCEILPLLVFNKDTSSSSSFIVRPKTGDGTVNQPSLLSAMSSNLQMWGVGGAQASNEKKERRFKKTSFLADASPSNHHFFTADSLHNHREEVRTSTVDIFFQNDYSFIPWAAVFFATLSRFAQT